MSPLPRRVALLLDAKRISTDQIAIAEAQQAGSRASLESALVALGFVTEAEVCAVVAAADGLAPVTLEDCAPDPEALACIPKILAQKLCVLPLALQPDGQGLVVAMPDIHDVMVLDEVRAELPPGMDLVPKIAPPTQIRRALDRAYGFVLSIDALLQRAWMCLQTAALGAAMRRLPLNLLMHYSLMVFVVALPICTSSPGRGLCGFVTESMG